MRRQILAAGPGVNVSSAACGVNGEPPAVRERATLERSVLIPSRGRSTMAKTTRRPRTEHETTLAHDMRNPSDRPR